MIVNTDAYKSKMSHFLKDLILGKLENYKANARTFYPNEDTVSRASPVS